MFKTWRKKNISKFFVSQNAFSWFTIKQIKYMYFRSNKTIVSVSFCAHTAMKATVTIMRTTPDRVSLCRSEGQPWNHEVFWDADFPSRYNEPCHHLAFCLQIKSIQCVLRDVTVKRETQRNCQYWSVTILYCQYMYIREPLTYLFSLQQPWNQGQFGGGNWRLFAELLE